MKAGMSRKFETSNKIRNSKIKFGREIENAFESSCAISEFDWNLTSVAHDGDEICGNQKIDVTEIIDFFNFFLLNDQFNHYYNKFTFNSWKTISNQLMATFKFNDFKSDLYDQKRHSW